MTATTETKVVPLTKADKARAIFAEMHGKPGVARKDVISRIMVDCDLSKPAAATYYQNAKAKAGLVNHKPQADTPVSEVQAVDQQPTVAESPKPHKSRRTK